MKKLNTDVVIKYDKQDNIKSITTPHDKNETLQNPIFALNYYTER